MISQIDEDKLSTSEFPTSVKKGADALSEVSDPLLSEKFMDKLINVDKSNLPILKECKFSPIPVISTSTQRRFIVTHEIQPASTANPDSLNLPAWQEDPLMMSPCYSPNFEAFKTLSKQIQPPLAEKSSPRIRRRLSLSKFSDSDEEGSDTISTLSLYTTVDCSSECSVPLTLHKAMRKAMSFMSRECADEDHGHNLSETLAQLSLREIRKD
jgi:hypothetical protein